MLPRGFGSAALEAWREGLARYFTDPDGPSLFPKNYEFTSEEYAAALNSLLNSLLLPSGLFGGSSFIGAGGGSAGGGSTPCNDAHNNRKRFFTMLPILNGVAARLNTPADFIVGLSSYESGWLDNHNYALRNLFGLTHAGGRNTRFSTFQASADYFVARVGAYIQNAQTLNAFLTGLANEGYNTKNPTYNATLTNRINNIGRWEAICGVK